LEKPLKFLLQIQNRGLAVQTDLEVKTLGLLPKSAQKEA